MSDTTDPTADGGVGLFLKLSASIDGLAAAQRAEAERRHIPQPVDHPIFGSAAFPSSGVLAMNLGGPQPGYVWEVRSLVVGGQTPTTTEGGRADVFVVASPGALITGAPAATDQPGRPGFVTGTGFANGCLQYWKDVASPLPNKAFYGRRELTVRPNQSLWVVFSSGTSTDVLIASGNVEQFEDAAYALVRGQ